MKRAALSFALILLLTACVTGAEQDKMAALYSKYDDHCRDHARDMVGEEDEESSYQECMIYFIKTDVDCPICGVGLH